MAAEDSVDDDRPIVTPPKPAGDQRRFMVLIALGLAFAILQTWFMPSGRSPSLARTTAEQAFALARDTPVNTTFGQLNDGKWQTAQLYQPGDDLMAACAKLSEGQEDCRTALAKPPKEVILLGFTEGKLTRIEQVPGSLVQLNACSSLLNSNQTVQLSRRTSSTAAQLDCLPSAP
ncbi:hypothetical protein [Chitinimonas sp. BJB300]|uniref:hypothetical protein n=1 Tax=Chitinimonas sp. BJB300 TaxID=1559339 RepID=UPI000C0FEEB4|nr:hypothetical protein [Chitinimonas sp. BJB300]PHV12012.1 hypothetical protein CSQ89_08090 [Chitinimonas sp. BJB300]TSJ91455.1 hypothetical protein FG002_004035 [Chitinimonas sp. BJB300]